MKKRLKYNYLLKQVVISTVKMFQMRKKLFFGKWILSFETLNSTFYANRDIF